MLLLLAVLALIPALGFAQTINYDAFQDSFEQFSNDVANSLPLNSAIGNNTPDAYIGQLMAAPPNFLLGFTVGASTIPYDTVEAVFKDLGISVPSSMEKVKSIGIPFPAYTLDARLGGFILPFDIGLKFGAVPSSVKALLPSGVDADFLLAGLDVRYALMKQTKIKPNISVGIGYNYLYGRVTAKDVIPAYQITELNSGDTIDLKNADATFTWNTSVIDLKAQVSKKLLVLTPYAGAGAAMAVSSAGGGLKSELYYNGSSTPATPAEIEAIKSALRAAGYPVPDELSNTDGIQVLSDSTGWAFRVFAGTAINIVMIHIDLGAGYDLLGKNLQGTLGVRFQL